MVIPNLGAGCEGVMLLVNKVSPASPKSKASEIVVQVTVRTFSLHTVGWLMGSLLRNLGAVEGHSRTANPFFPLCFLPLHRALRCSAEKEVGMKSEELP